ncbi:MAG: nucleotidyltransferase domain-containing protein, partial [Pseudomonadota bacterium]
QVIRSIRDGADQLLMMPFSADTMRHLAALCTKHRVQRLAIFGSAGGDRFDPATSDIDFLVEFLQPASPIDHADQYFGLLEDLECLLKRPVDLVELKPIRNPYFRRSVEQTRTVLYEAA